MRKRLFGNELMMYCNELTSSGCTPTILYFLLNFNLWLTCPYCLAAGPVFREVRASSFLFLGKKGISKRDRISSRLSAHLPTLFLLSSVGSCTKACCRSLMIFFLGSRGVEVREMRMLRMVLMITRVIRE